MSAYKVTYLGKLRTENEHLKSGDKFLTDAPVDNMGKGEAFSPTDTLAASLANCMLTVMGIKADNLGVDLKGSVAMVSKTMTSNPRRIAKIEVEVQLPKNVDPKSRQILENTANTCPVIYSLHPDIENKIDYHWVD